MCLPCGDWDWGLKLFPINEEFPVSAGHKLALIKSLPFGHTARRYYRLDGLVRSSDRDSQRRGGGGCGGARGFDCHLGVVDCQSELKLICGSREFYFESYPKSKAGQVECQFWRAFIM